MGKIKEEARGTARCEACLFWRGVTIIDLDKNGKETPPA